MASTLNFSVVVTISFSLIFLSTFGDFIFESFISALNPPWLPLLLYVSGYQKPSESAIFSIAILIKDPFIQKLSFFNGNCNLLTNFYQRKGNLFYSLNFLPTFELGIYEYLKTYLVN